ncbi:hypothetical protein ACAG24_024175 [Mycobacterium sp. pW049]|uniref:hypothetical protein n=1 Tax=[Mycobacterium] bulgaricum TaxID=3238985 RepID=UPI00351BB635
MLEFDAANESWVQRAAELTQANRDAACHLESGNIWSKIKPVFVELQQKKCGYCERVLGSGAIEWDVEHFRPKKKVDAWADGESIRDIGGSDATGYYLLAYEPENYLASCKRCNSTFKSNYFPTAAPRMTSATEAADLRQEKAYLLDPADPEGLDPELAIRWKGIFPKCGQQDGFPGDQARTTIAILGLATRDDLLRERARTLFGVWLAFKALRNGDQTAHADLDLLCSSHFPHASCARAFRQLCEDDFEAAADEYHQRVEPFLSPHQLKRRPRLR